MERSNSRCKSAVLMTTSRGTMSNIPAHYCDIATHKVFLLLRVGGENDGVVWDALLSRKRRFISTADDLEHSSAGRGGIKLMSKAAQTPT